MIRRRHDRVRVLVLGMAALAIAGSAAAQEDSPDFWGTGTNFHFVNANEFESWDHNDAKWRYYAFGFWNFIGGTGKAYATVRLPTGSLVTGMTIIYTDLDPNVDSDVSVKLQRDWVSADGTRGVEDIATFQSFGNPGTTAFWLDIVPDRTIQYIDGSTAQSYSLEVSMPPYTLLDFRGVIIGWNRQVSPAPVSATFADVPTGHWAFQFIEALAASGITGGCGGGDYCPNNPITRAEMAVFLSGALGLHWAP